MKIFVYSYREFDEAEYFQKFSKEYGVASCRGVRVCEYHHDKDR